MIFATWVVVVLAAHRRNLTMIVSRAIRHRRMATIHRRGRKVDRRAKKERLAGRRPTTSANLVDRATKRGSLAGPRPRNFATSAVLGLADRRLRLRAIVGAKVRVTPAAV